MAIAKNSALKQTLLDAREPDAIIAAAARVVYRRAHPGRDCPDGLVPDERALMQFLRVPESHPDYEDGIWRPFESDRLTALYGPRFGASSRWGWGIGVREYPYREGYRGGLEARCIEIADEDCPWVEAVYERPTEPAGAAAWDAADLPERHVYRFRQHPPSFFVEDMHTDWRALPEADRGKHPLEAFVAAWQAAQRETAEPFRPRVRASLPRFERTTIEEARLLAHHQSALDSGQGQIALLHADDVVDSCPAWLLDMFRRAVSVRTGQGLGSTRGGMPWSFTLTIGGLAHYAIEDRLQWAPNGRDLPFAIDETIGWLHPEGWKNRRRDWASLDAAFEETPSYRVTVNGERFSVVSAYGLPAVYSGDARVTLNVRVPPSAAHGARFDWNRYHVAYAKRAAHQRALLATAGLLDKTAHRGNPLTRLVREPVVDDDGKPKRERIVGSDGKPKRDRQGRYKTRGVFTGNLVPNPLLGSVQPAILPDKHLALFLGMANTASNRRDAKAALHDLERDDVIDLERVPNGYRIFGPSPKTGAPR